MARHASIAELGNRHHDNDNFLTGAGNIKWAPSEITNLNHSETSTLAAPFTKLHGHIIEAENAIAKSKCKFASVYVVSDIYGDTCKIGMAAVPSKRLAQLQTGNPKRLFIHRLFWIFCERYNVSDISRSLEQNSHVEASRRYYREVGEWFRCTPSEAHDVVVSEIGDLMEAGYITKYCAMTPHSDIWRP